jgi:pimeloyl-ACP methyl ester carboxylesterase
MVETPNGVHRLRLAGDGPPLIVIPGGPGFGATYLVDSVVEALADVARLVFVDQRGAGKSPVGSAPLSMTEYVNDTFAIADALDIGRFDIMGHSFGGLQTACVAIADPDRVLSAILLDADGPTREHSMAALAPGTPIYQRTRATDVEEKAQLMSDKGWMSDQDKVDRWVNLEFRAYYADPTTTEQVPHDFDGQMYLQWTVTSDAVRDSLGDWDIRQSLRDVSLPVLLMYCRESLLGSEIPKVYADALPNAELVFVAGGHTPPIEDPEEFRRLTRAFLAKTHEANAS